MSRLVSADNGASLKNHAYPVLPHNSLLYVYFKHIYIIFNIFSNRPKRKLPPNYADSESYPSSAHAALVSTARAENSKGTVIQSFSLNEIINLIISSIA